MYEQLTGHINPSGGESLLCDDVIELLLGDQPIVVGVRPFDHLLQFGLVDRFPQLLGDPSEILYGYESGLLIVKKVEDFADVFPGVLVGYPCGHQLQELLKVDLPTPIGVQIGDHLIYCLILGLEAQRGHSSLEFCMRQWVPLGSMLPPPSVSKRSKAYLISITSYSVRPGR